MKNKFRWSFYILVVFLLTTWTSVERVCLPYLFIFLFHLFIYVAAVRVAPRKQYRFKSTTPFM